MILIVEDHSGLRELLLTLLGSAGFDVTAAETGGAVVASFKDSLPDLMILDIGLPDITGWAVLEQLRALEIGRRTPVIVFSALDQRETARARLADADAVLIKGVSTMADLLATVERLLPGAKGRAIMDDPLVRDSIRSSERRTLRASRGAA